MLYIDLDINKKTYIANLEVQFNIFWISAKIKNWKYNANAVCINPNVSKNVIWCCMFGYFVTKFL